MEVFKTYKENEKIVNGMVVAVSEKAEYLVKYLPQICMPFVEEIKRMESV